MPLSLISAPALAQDPTPPPTTPPSAPATPTGKALAQAKKDNRRIEIESLRSENTTYYANPDGKTLRMEQYLEPIRVKNADGKGFTPIDTTLIEANGVIKPKAAKGGLTLSAGGDTEAIRSKSGDLAARIDAPRTLPKPTLNGNTATYPSAYGKGIDLVVTTTPTGFRQQIVIRQRPAEPVTFRVPVDLPKGISFGKNAKGQPTLKNQDGKHSLDIRPAALLDAKAADANADLGTVRVGRAQVSLDDSALVYSPDAAFLADPATTFPVTMAAIDDDWYECTLGGDPCPPGDPMDTYINDVDLTDSWDMHYRDQMWVGKSYASGIAKRWRAYIQFPLPKATDPFWGSNIQNADLELWNYLSNDCGEFVGSGITARRVTSDWDHLTLQWGNQPSVTNVGADTEYGAYSPDCAGSMNYEHDLIHSVDTIVQDWADGETNYGFQLRAGDESELRNWRRYRSREQTSGYPAHGPRLTVDFEPPVPPRQETVVISSPTLMETFPEYEEAIQKSVFVPESEADREELGLSPEVARMAAAKRDGQPYFVGSDMLNLGGPEPEGDDATDPDEEEVFSPRVLTHEPAGNATGVPLDAQIRMTFTEPVGETAVSVKPSSGAEVEGALSEDTTKKTVTFTPRQPLSPGTTYTVTVSGAIDEWDNQMSPYTWSFRTTDQAAAHWTFDEGTGKIVADSSGNGHSASLNDTAAWIAGKSGNAISNVPSQARIAASSSAAKQGKAVEVTDETTATSITYALPDGKAFRTEVAAGPIRTKQNGVWVPIDTTLFEHGGVLRPKAIASNASVEISTGGAGTFVRMTAHGQSYALRWPTPLPKPMVKGGVVTYTDAAGAGADLVVTVLPTGFRHDVVLRQRPSKPLELRIGVESDGLTLSEGKGGRLLLKGKDKKLVASAPQPIMWDGSAKGRLPLARHAVIDTEVVSKTGRTELVLKPDHAFLSDSKTVYPVRVDPTTTLPSNNDLSVLSTDTADSPAYPTSTALPVGVQTGQKMRALLRFDTTSLVGKTVTDARLSMSIISAKTCGASVGQGVQAARVTGAWDENNLYWANKPAFTTEDAQINKTSIDCASTQTPTEWNITGISQDWAAGAANHGLVLKAPTENTTIEWRMYASSDDTEWNAPPKLVVTTSAPASSPTIANFTITPAQDVAGTTVTSSLTPQLAATVADTAGGNLTGEFEVEHDPAATGQGTGQIWAGASSAVASGSQAAVGVPAGKLADGWKVRWRARAVNAAAATASAWSSWQTATVDVPNPTVGAFQVTPSQVVNGVTVSTSVTPTLRTTVTDPAAQPVRAEFEVEHDPAATTQGTGQIWTGAVDNVASGTQASIAVPNAKLTDGWKVRWRVRAINTATTVSSLWSDWQLLTVDVPDPASEPSVGALQVTPSEQVDGTTVTPTLTPALLTQVSDPAGKPLRVEAEIDHDPAATGQGSGQIWVGSADNVPVGTQAAITVPADKLADGWKVRWRARAVSATAASTWSGWQSLAISLPKPTATGLTITPSKVVDGVMVTTALTPTLQATLTHPTGQALRAEAEIEHDPAATGQGTGQIWAGAVDNVASGTQASIAVPAGKLTDGWKVRWRARAVGDQASSAWSDWQQVTVDVIQPGEEPLAQAAGPVIRTDQSFTAAAWLRWSDKDGDYTVLEQKGTHQAPFRLGNTADHGLAFTFTSADTADATVEGVLSGVEPPVDEWFHLAGVYDVAAKSASLYLNGTQVGSAQLISAGWRADAPMRLGANMLGAIDELELYQRPLSGTELGALLARSASVAAPQNSAPVESGATKATTTAGIPVYNFKYDHINEQNCKDTTWFEKNNLARIQEKPYLSCWSAYLYIQDFSEDSDTRRLKKAAKSGSLFKMLASTFGSAFFDDSDRFRFRATWVVHSYLGDDTGNNIVNPAPNEELKPQDMKVFIRVDEMAVEDANGRVKLSSAQLRGLPMRVRLDAEPGALWGTDCKVRSGTDQTKDVSEWYAKPDSRYIVRAMPPDDPTKNNWCQLEPQVEIFDDPERPDVPMRFYLWSQIVKDENGDDRRVRRKGDTINAQNGDQAAVPLFRCDWKKFGFQKADIHIGGCINHYASRVFAMSKKRDTLFPEVIEHIETALNPETNATTFPYLRDGHDWSQPGYPPTRNKLGNERPKNIAGNWADPNSEPLVRNPDKTMDKANRKYFSDLELHLDSGTTSQQIWPKGVGTNYCKYYMPEKYGEPYYNGGPPRGLTNSCDEYPFASTIQGALHAKGHFSVRAVDHQQNIDHGHVLRSFFSHYRVGGDNEFWVLIQP
ncbi:hypothetical protein FHU36_006465 [Nonomuraea muscovyensis]|uniref:LamG-like jellyroll fold domain-containing protein n=1 Tax=Nonomuraea muscovyensis TaxID=1124761 RepID=A0A7X0EZJ9_9ACTN|nr:DNRLRE domain-containing protein [Nonomuraea muscovyensis]MBB6349893.1 hypothetical protein [Nonomuraea muscovyensis]